MHRPVLAAFALVLACPVASAQAQPAAQASATNTPDGFARAAAENNLSEIMLATMALQKTSDKRVQDDAWTMLDHHSRALGDLAEALNDGAAALPTEPRAEQKAMLQRMRGLNGSQFDQAYFTHQLEAHQRAVSLFEQGQQLADQKLAQYARTTLPVLRAHREITQTRQSQAPQPMPGQ